MGHPTHKGRQGQNHLHLVSECHGLGPLLVTSLDCVHVSCLILSITFGRLLSLSYKGRAKARRDEVIFPNATRPVSSRDGSHTQWSESRAQTSLSVLLQALICEKQVGWVSPGQCPQEECNHTRGEHISIFLASSILPGTQWTPSTYLSTKQISQTLHQTPLHYYFV